MEEKVHCKICCVGLPEKVLISCNVPPTEIEERIDEVACLLPYPKKYHLDKSVFPEKDKKQAGYWEYMLRL